MSNRVRITFGKVTRGGGKVFVRVDAPGATKLAASSKGEADGRALPAGILRVDDAWVAYVPVLDCAQRLCVSVLDEDGSVVGSASKTVGHLRSKLASSVNTLRKDAVAERIRNADRKVAPAGVHLALEELLADGDVDILRGTVELRFLDEALASRPITVEVLSTSGRSATAALAIVDDVVFSDAPAPAPADAAGLRPLPNGTPTGAAVRRLRFSCRLDARHDGLVAWARVDGLPEWDAFEVLEPFEVDGLRERSGRRYLSAAESDEYARLVARDEAELPRRLEQMRSAVPLMPERPLFSVVVPVYNTPLDFFGEMVDSVLGQVYPDFELLLVNASPENAELAGAIDEAVRRDRRVRRIDLESNLGITENTNAGIRAAAGDFLCFLDHDDTIEPDALWRYARAVCETPGVDLIYCDEDHLLDGRRVGPFYKPDWDPELLCSENYVTHLLCVRREAVLSAGELPTSEFDGSQDHNLTLVVGERARAVCHVPHILYHWRMHALSTAGSEGVGQKSYALEAERRAVQAHLDRRGVSATAVMERRREMRCDVVYDLAEKSRVSACIAHAKGNPNLAGCVDALLSSCDWPDLEVVVAGPLSPEERSRLEGGLPRGRRLVVACADASLSLPATLNRAVAAATGEYVLLLDENACAFEGTDWLDELVGPVALAGVSCAGAKLARTDATIACAGYLVGEGLAPRRAYEGYPIRATGYYEYNVLPHRVSAVSASCMLLRRDRLALGLAEDLPSTFDVSLCLDLWDEGGVVLQQNNALVTLADAPTRRSSTAARAERAREQGLLLSRHAEAFARHDPYYTPSAGRGNRYFGYGEDGDL